MERINRLSKPALSGQATSTMLKKKKKGKTKQTTFLQQTFFGRYSVPNLVIGAGNIAMGKLKFLFSTSKSPRAGFQVKASKRKHRDG